MRALIICLLIAFVCTEPVVSAPVSESTADERPISVEHANTILQPARMRDQKPFYPCGGMC